MIKKIYEGNVYYVPETLKDIFDLNHRINECTEFEGYYYIQISLFKVGENMDNKIVENNNDICKVDKKTGRIVPCPLDFIGYMMDIRDYATPVDPETLRKRAS